jgi:hypothetical protein
MPKRPPWLDAESIMSSTSGLSRWTLRLNNLTPLILAAVLATALPLAPQTAPLRQLDPITEQKLGATDDVSRAKMERDMAKKANQARQADLKRDTDKLLKLAGELKEYVDKSDEGTLSLDVLKKAGEIEKLAHSVKDKMKGY